MLTNSPQSFAHRAPTVSLVTFAAVAIAALWVSARNYPVPIPVVAKVVPLALLLRAAIGGLRKHANGYRFGIVFGLTASLAGDIAIEYNFIAGIGAFLVAHIGYILAMGGRGLLGGKQAAALLPGLGLWGGMLYLLAPRVPAEMFLPVVAYLTVISLMWIRALALAWHENTAGAWCMAAGATLFVVSDSCIAINRWLAPIPSSSLVIMVTYYAAQWLIARSIPEN